MIAAVGAVVVWLVGRKVGRAAGAAVEAEIARQVREADQRRER
jgi:hypothetical protein